MIGGLTDDEMLRDLLILSAVPTVLIAFTAWHRTLLSAIPATIGIYVAFLVSLFTVPFAEVIAIWLAFAILIIPILWWQFPGQYTVARSLTSFFFWPVLAALIFLTEKQESFSALPDEIPGQITGKVDFIDAPGTDGDYIMVFLAEYGDTVFFCDGALESRANLKEDEVYRFNVERANIDELGDEVLWLTAPARVIDEVSGRGG